MKKKLISLLCVICLLALSACSNTNESTQTQETKPETAAATDTKAQSETPAAGETAATEDTKESELPQIITDGVAARIGSLKGPTSMGLVSMIDKNERAENALVYDFSMVTAADELVAAISNKSVDIALVPANVASVLYNKTGGAVQVLNINTLGVLYIVESGDSVKSIADLKGKTLYLTGKGTTPDYVLAYLLAQNGLTADDVTLEYKSEATEVAAVLAQDENAIGLLPQPFVTVACAQNDKLHIALDLTKEWDNVQGESKSQLVTGVTIVRKEFLEENQDIVDIFLAESKASVAFTNEQPEDAAALIESQGIVAKAAIAQKAIPYCNITYIDGEEMKQALSGYLQVLFEQDPKSVGGSLPGDDFYVIGQ